MHPRINNFHGEVNITRTVVDVIHSQNPSFLNFAHFNAQSLCANKLQKTDEIRNFLNNSSFDVVGISETWLKPHINSRLVDMQNFNFVRNDRLHKRGGGVGIYIKSDIKYSVVATSIENHSSSSSSSNNEYVTTGLQFIFVELLVNHHKLLFGVIYNPNSTLYDNRNFLQPVLDNLTPLYEDIIITGDLNTNIINSTNSRVSDLINLISEYDLFNFSNSPTHFSFDGRNHSSSCIDLVITNHNNKIISFNQIDFPGISHHDLIFFTYDIPRLAYAPESYYIRDYKNINIQELVCEVSSYSWNEFFNLSSADELIDYFNNVVNNLFNRFVPIRMITPTNYHHPWFTNELKILVSRRDLAYRIWKSSRTLHSHSSFKSIRNLTVAAIKKAKADYFKRYVSVDVNPKQLWKRLKNIGVTHSNNVNLRFLPNEINSSFTSQNSQSVNPVIDNETIETQRPGTNEGFAQSYRFSFSNISSPDVILAIKNLKSNSMGNDDISLKFVKILLPFFVPLITHIFNFILTSSQFPSAWKIGKVIPIPKCSRPKTVKDLRPITILSCLSKAFEYVVKDQINAHLREFNLLTESQSGFRIGRSTETALLTVTDDLLQMIDKKNIALLTLLDFSKAFDLVDHNILLNKLFVNFNFDTSAVSLINSYLSNRSQFVSINGECSSTLAVQSGVPQGSILGPLLFSMFINDLPSTLDHCKIHMFADDVQLYLDDKAFALNRLVENLNSDLNKISAWAQLNKLILNPTKSTCILLSLRNSSNYINMLPPILLNNQEISVGLDARNLGVIFDSSLNWESQVNKICANVYAGLRSLYSSSSLTNLELRAKLVRTLLLPHFTYCCSVLGQLHSYIFRKLQKCFNSCLRYIYRRNRRTSITPYSYRFLGCTLRSFLIYRNCVMTHKILKSEKPQCLYDRFSRGISNRRSQLNIRHHRTDVMNKSFFVYSTKLYNKLPINLKQLNPINFKGECFDYVCSNENGFNV